MTYHTYLIRYLEYALLVGLIATLLLAGAGLTDLPRPLLDLPAMLSRAAGGAK